MARTSPPTRARCWPTSPPRADAWMASDPLPDIELFDPDGGSIWLRSMQCRWLVIQVMRYYG